MKRLITILAIVSILVASCADKASETGHWKAYKIHLISHRLHDQPVALDLTNKPAVANIMINDMIKMPVEDIPVDSLSIRLAINDRLKEWRVPELTVKANDSIELKNNLLMWLDIYGYQFDTLFEGYYLHRTDNRTLISIKGDQSYHY